MKLSIQEQGYLEGAFISQAKFLRKQYYLTISRYRLASEYVANKIVLDAGCGSGYGSTILTRAGAKKVYGIDNNLESIKYCRIHSRNKKTVFQQENLTSLSFPENFFDLICSFEVIEHIVDYRLAISELYRTLKPGGLLILSTPNKTVYSPDSRKPFNPFHCREFYPQELKKKLNQFTTKKILGQHCKNEKILFPVWHPKRIIRKIYADLPFMLKIEIMRWYLRVYFWLDKSKIYRSIKIKLSDIYFSKDLSKARFFVIICQKPRKENKRNNAVTK